MASATAVHGALSLAYTALLAPLAERGSAGRAAAAGAAFGIALYAINLHALTALFPWFVAARGWITVVAHVAFGIAGALTWRWARRPRDA
jgi:hypothetical protein